MLVSPDHWLKDWLKPHKHYGLGFHYKKPYPLLPTPQSVFSPQKDLPPKATAIYKRVNTQKFNPVLIIKNWTLSNLFILCAHMQTQNKVFMKYVRGKGWKRGKEPLDLFITSLFLSGDARETLRVIRNIKWDKNCTDGPVL